MLSDARWTTVTESQFSWEHEALKYVCEHLPDQNPYRAWSNFEFLGLDNSINEVDLLVLGSEAAYLIEIKSMPGPLTGNQGAWRWVRDGVTKVMDNPVVLADLKAKRLRALIERYARRGQRSNDRRTHLVPPVWPLVFWSVEDGQCSLDEDARLHLSVRDELAKAMGVPGIINELTRQQSQRPPDPAQGLSMLNALDRIGICRPRSRRVGGCVLGSLLCEGPGYQDHEARIEGHPDVLRRVRRYLVLHQAERSDQQRLRRAAKHEFQILQTLQHRGILRAFDYQEHELGPALVFDHERGSVPLDEFLAKKQESDDRDRVALLRQLAEAIAYAHEKHVVHGTLSPQSILVCQSKEGRPRIQVFNWLLSSFENKPPVTAHGDCLLNPATTAYVAPEALRSSTAVGEQADVFSLGAIAYLLFLGQPPADDANGLLQILRRDHGLCLPDATGAVRMLVGELVRESTNPDVSRRLGSVREFLRCLDRADQLLRAEAAGEPPDPREAVAGDKLAGRFRVVSRLGSGATAIALAVEEQGTPLVIKIARSPDQNELLQAEAEALEVLRHPNVVELCDVTEIAGLVTLVLRPAGRETMAEWLREEGAVTSDALERLGDTLLQTVEWLEQKGVPHRDIKPENLGIDLGPDDRPSHLVLFDFSLSRASSTDVRLGTHPYLDPFLSLRDPPHWDWHAERFAAAMTLCEMATGQVPVWGDGRSDPAVLDCEATLATERFEPPVREGLVEFFQRALRRDYRERFESTRAMLQAWRRVFLERARPAAPQVDSDEVDPLARIEQVNRGSDLAALAISAPVRAVAAELGIQTINDLLTMPLGRIYTHPALGLRCRREISDIVLALQLRFAASPATTDTAASASEPSSLGSDLEAQQFDEQLRKTLAASRFIMLTATKGELDRVQNALVERFDFEPRSLDRLLLRLLKAEAAAERLDWPTVLRPIEVERGATSGREHRRTRDLLLGRVLPRLRAELQRSRRPVLVLSESELGSDRLSLLMRIREWTQQPDWVNPVCALTVRTSPQASSPDSTSGHWMTVPTDWCAESGR